MALAVTRTCGAGNHVVAMVLAAALATAGSASAAEFTAVSSGRFNASDANTWGLGLNTYPTNSGDVANIVDFQVQAGTAGEVTNLTVNLSGTAQLRCLDLASPAAPIHSNATVNLYPGSILRGGKNCSFGFTANLYGGRLMFEIGANFINTSVLNVYSNTEVFRKEGHRFRIQGKVTGGGKLSVTGSAGTTTDEGDPSFASSSTWTGAWDITSGNVTFPNASSLPGDLRVAPSANATARYQGAYVIKGTLSGGGTNSVFFNNALTIGDGSTNAVGRGWLSPGDLGVSSNVGRVTVTAHGAGNANATLRFASNATYRVDLAGAAGTQHDRVSLLPVGAGTGTVEILPGAILDVTLWHPATPTVLDATIIDCPSGASGAIVGAFSQTNWFNTTDWANLRLEVVDNDLHVMGRYPRVTGALMVVK